MIQMGQPSMNVIAENPEDAASESLSRSYDRIASSYDWQTDLATGGQNLAARLAQIEEMGAGDRVLYVGVGSAEDAIEAARKGVDVTCLDLSEGMVEMARRRFAQAGLPGNFVCADVMRYQPERPFDAVTANFFLNVFSRPVMEEILARLGALVRPGGKLLIADFAPVQGNVVLRVLHRAYYGTGNFIYWMKGLCALHRIYIYADSYPRLGLTLQKTLRFRVFRRGPWMFQTTVAIKDGANGTPDAGK